ncbi:4947_t:CDS:1, partial [Funneliformis mosseae]
PQPNTNWIEKKDGKPTQSKMSNNSSGQTQDSVGIIIIMDEA